MVLNQIINLLRQNEELAQIVQSIEPYNQVGIHNGIVYTFNPQTDDGIKRLDRLELHIIATTIDVALQIDAIVRRVMLTIADEKLLDDIYSVQLNGGGSLQETASNTIHMYHYYTVVSLGGKING